MLIRLCFIFSSTLLLRLSLRNRFGPGKRRADWPPAGPEGSPTGALLAGMYWLLVRSEAMVTGGVEGGCSAQLQRWPLSDVRRLDAPNVCAAYPVTTRPERPNDFQGRLAFVCFCVLQLQSNGT